MKRPGSATDPLWFKDAVIYELHVRAFMDGNGDGVGDFVGLIQKLDYLQDLGVTCLWLLPFFPSPLRDDGYDISDYTNVNPSYGTIADFQEFLKGAHERGLQVMIELVMNHTSDQHPWFQAARKAPAGSPERNFYVWSDTADKYPDARIIFTDTEKSNWTWDPVAQAYFWHRFFSHQPDLNYDNPVVVEEMLKVMRFWLDMGVDALRVDAVPYLIERDGTNCENLPDTHTIIRRVRQEIDENYSNRMMLAEANQWPSDVRPYFGDGDEFHMAFHFPLMPRMYMALRQEDRLPITDIMAQTPEIPESCQWGLFLRNHDELTLEMVTNDERDYMYLAYSADPRMRINIGIRRRLAPLMDNNRRRIELLNSLLLSFPGTPIVYYGDEIGMGDNIYLGDRNGVRTPMQWNADRNAGFSRAIPAKLYSPVVMDPVWGYEAVNVEAEQSDPSSLLNWTRNMIALRKLFRVFGRGTFEFLSPSNRKVLAYLRRSDGEQVLCVANLSRFAQPVDLDLAGLEGMVPVEMLGYVEFPPITRQPYRLTLGAYGFLWLELHASSEERLAPDLTALTMAGGWSSIFDGPVRHRFELVVLPEFLPKQRWFSGKSRQIQATRILDWTGLTSPQSCLVLAEVQFASGPPETYFLPLAISMEGQVPPSAILTSVLTPEGAGVIYDAAFADDTCIALLDLIGHEVAAKHGVVRGVPGNAWRALRGEETLPVRRGSAEQSNSSVFFDERLILKIYRKCEAGPNPDAELGRYLTEEAGFNRVPPFGGTIEYQPKEGAATTLGLFQGFVQNEGDGWKWTLEELQRYLENCAPLPFSEGADHVGLYLDAAATLGRRTAELHRALGSLAPEPLTEADLRQMKTEWHDLAVRAFDLLKDNVSTLPDEVVEAAGSVLGRRREILERFRMVPEDGGLGQKIRIHGDYHLGQVLRVKTDFIILDFEGEPGRPLAERLKKQSPLKDVAGMLRSFSYGAITALTNYTSRRAEDFSTLEPWARLWEESVSREFLRAYREAADLPRDFEALLEALWLDKALYELIYELNNRPTWVRIPLIGLSRPRPASSL